MTWRFPALRERPLPLNHLHCLAVVLLEQKGQSLAVMVHLLVRGHHHLWGWEGDWRRCLLGLEGERGRCCCN